MKKLLFRSFTATLIGATTMNLILFGFASSAFAATQPTIASLKIQVLYGGGKQPVTVNVGLNSAHLTTPPVFYIDPQSIGTIITVNTDNNADTATVVGGQSVLYDTATPDMVAKSLNPLNFSKYVSNWVVSKNIAIQPSEYPTGVKTLLKYIYIRNNDGVSGYALSVAPYPEIDDVAALIFQAGSASNYNTYTGGVPAPVSTTDTVTTPVVTPPVITPPPVLSPPNPVVITPPVITPPPVLSPPNPVVVVPTPISYTFTPIAAGTITVAFTPKNWSVPNATYPVSANQTIGFIQINSTAAKPVELKSINLQLASNKVYQGKINLISLPSMPDAAQYWTIFSTKDNRQTVVSSVGANTSGKKDAKITGVTGFGSDSINFPMNGKIILQPKATITLAVTADQIDSVIATSTPILIGSKLVSVTVREPDKKSDTVYPLGDSAPQSIAQFSPVHLSVTAASTIKAGVNVKSTEQIIGKFVIKNEKTAAKTPADIVGLQLNIIAKNNVKLDKKSTAQVMIYKDGVGAANLVYTGALSKILNAASATSTAFTSPVTIASDVAQTFVITTDTSVLVKGHTTIQTVLGAVIMGKSASAFQSAVNSKVSTKGKILIY